MGKFDEVIKGAVLYADMLKQYEKRPMPDLNGKKIRIPGDAKSSPKEVVIQKRILDWCKHNKQYVKRVWRNNTQGRIIQTKDGPIMGNGFSKGTSDILGWLQGGIILAIEVKRPGSYIDPQQREFIDSCAGDGGCAMVATSCNDVIRKIEEVLRLPQGTIPRVE